jgi:methylenetetrahydrofolate dehydrogenase (NADP+)/methenyltetrahydrofolate cyclohydrolase
MAKMYQILDGKKVSQRVKNELKDKVAKLKNNGINPGLAVIIVGNDSASRVYVNNKKKACEYIGIRSEEYALPQETTEEELLALVDKLNKKDDIHGILCQLPLPKHINEEKILYAIDPRKDVDAFHPVNVGKIMIGDFDFLPCTPAGVMDLIEESGIDLTGKECVVIGRSNIVGKPQAMLLLHKNATVTICHSKTRDLKEVCKRADVFVVAVGRAKMVDESYIKDGAVVIDVGMDRDENGKLCGDVDFDSACKKAGYITPVPGGVGPMTIATLMRNAVTAAIKQN